MITADAWTTANQRYLTVAAAETRAALERYAQQGRGGAALSWPGATPSGEAAEAIAAAMARPPALEQIRAVFGLSRFERALLLLCAAMELDGSFAALCAEVQGDPARP